MVAPTVYLPTILILSLTIGTLTQLQDIAQHSADKAIAQATDANNAIDCAYQARLLAECSPNLFSHDFNEESLQTQAILDDLQTQQAGSNLVHS